jgi:ribosome-associated protein
MGRIYVTADIFLEEAEIEETFVASPGPGGQNVNRVATAVQLRFDAARSETLPEEVRRRLLRLAGRRVSASGVLTIQAHRHRTQAQNRRDARERLAALIRAAAVPPKPRLKTRPGLEARRRRLEMKRRRGQVKRTRRPAGRVPDEV